MKLILQCLFAPRLQKIYKEGQRDVRYHPSALERWSDKIIRTAHTIWRITLYSTPLIGMYVYRNGLFTLEDLNFVVRFIGSIGCLLACSYFVRAYGRANNLKYLEFLADYNRPRENMRQYLENLRKYDYEYSAHPVLYSVAPERRQSLMERLPFTECANNDLNFLKRVIIQILAFLATHTFGLRIIYPGCLAPVRSLLESALEEGRTTLLEQFNGKRAKVETADGNIIDTVFVDNRPPSSKGNILVICCEGNSGFYEIGVMLTPIKVGYSALGWNHPGFAYSTGSPYPAQERNAIDAVIQYALNELGFEPSNIVLMGWSIGGYPAVWGAVNYPEIGGLILDATFDDLLPLAQKQMPESWCNLVKEVVRSYVNLNIAEMLTKYHGPVKIVRRTEDEIICLTQGQISTNRGNDLLLKLIASRHPEVWRKNAELFRKFMVLVEAQRMALLKGSPDENTKEVITLINKYLRDFNSGHCNPLRNEDFEILMRELNVASNKASH